MRSLVCFIVLIPLVASSQFTAVETFAGNGVPALLDGSLLNSEFSWPYGVCHDPITDAIFVADAQNNCIRKIQDGIVTTVAGMGIPGDLDGLGVNARFQTPTGVYFKNGYLYICDDLNSKIKRMDGSGNVITIAGNGMEGFYDGPAMQAEFFQPKSLVVDNNGVVYVADYENHRIRKIEDGVVSTYAGTGNAGDGTGPALLADLHRPRDLCLDDAGNLYFVDLMNNKVKVVTTDGMVELVAGSGIAGWADGTGADAQFDIPVAIDWLSPGVLVILDAVNPRLRKVTTTGVVTTIAGSGVAGYVDGPLFESAFALPQDVCVDNEGRIYVGDRDNNVIRVLTVDDTIPLPPSRSLAPHTTCPTFSRPVRTDTMTSSFPSPTATSIGSTCGSSTAGARTFSPRRILTSAGTARWMIMERRFRKVCTSISARSIRQVQILRGECRYSRATSRSCVQRRIADPVMDLPYAVVIRTRSHTYHASFIKQ